MCFSPNVGRVINFQLNCLPVLSQFLVLIPDERLNEFLVDLNRYN